MTQVLEQGRGGDVDQRHRESGADVRRRDPTQELLPSFRSAHASVSQGARPRHEPGVGGLVSRPSGAGPARGREILQKRVSGSSIPLRER